MLLTSSKPLRYWIVRALLCVGVLAVLVAVILFDPTAREVAGETARTVFQILTSPFILETSLAIIGLCIVLAINHYRQHKEGDGWVYLQQQQTPAPTDAAAHSDPPHRHDAVVWQEKPAAFNEAGAAFDVIDGYLDLGLVDEALQELASLPPHLRHEVQADALAIRASVMAGNSAAARCDLDDALKRHPDQAAMFSTAGLAVASWLQRNQGSRDEITAWLDKVRQMHPQAIRELPGNDPLRGFLVG